MPNIAILSPQENGYSETFIQAHKNGLNGTRHYYFGSFLPIYLDATNNKLSKGFFKIIYRLIGNIKGIKYFDLEQALLHSWKNNKIDIILAEYGMTAAKSLKAIKKSSLPLIVHFHGYDAFKYDIIEEYREHYLEVFNYAKYVISVSNFMTSQLLDLGCPPEKIILNPYGPNNDFSFPTRTEKPLNFVSVGRFCHKKAPQNTIRAFAEVVKKYPEAQLNMIGDGVLLDDCKTLIKQLNIEKSVSFLGVLTSKDISKVFANSCAFVQHSIRDEFGDAEGLPVAVLEAGLAGLPVIATRHSGIPDVIHNNMNGLLCEEGDIIQMSKNMIFICDNKEIAHQMGRNAKKHIEENYTITRHLKKLDELIALSLK